MLKVLIGACHVAGALLLGTVAGLMLVGALYAGTHIRETSAGPRCVQYQSCGCRYPIGHRHRRGNHLCAAIWGQSSRVVRVTRARAQ